MNQKKAKALRKLAASIATEADSTTNENINLKQIKTNKLVMNDKGIYVNEIFPLVVFNTMWNKNGPKAIYKQLKHES